MADSRSPLIGEHGMRGVVREASPTDEASVVYEPHSTSLQVVRGLLAAERDDVLVWGSHTNSYAYEGWYRLELSVSRSSTHPDVLKARAAGYLEAYLTAPQIDNYWYNYRMNEYPATGGQPSQELLDYVERQAGFVRDHMSCPHTDPDESLFWSTMALVMAQFDGLVDGYAARCEDTPRPVGAHQAPTAPPRRKAGAAGDGVPPGSSTCWALNWQELYLLQSVGDLYDLNVVFPTPPVPPASPPPSTATRPAGASDPSSSSISSSTAGKQQQQQQQQSSSELPVPFGRPLNMQQRQYSSGSTAPAGDQSQRYTPGHGIVGPNGFDDLLECTALIKLAAGPAPQSSGPAQGSAASQDSAASSGQGSAASKGSAASSRGQGSAAARMQRLSTAGATGGGGGGAEAGRGGRGEDSGEGASSAESLFWAGHITWRPYYAMIRTWKVYDFPWVQTGPLSIASSPGLLHSKDDWYTTDGLVIMETTNGIYNKSLYDAITDQCALTWQRVQVANFGSTGGRSWAALFSQYNSGTYNNGWMVLDVDLLDAGGATEDVLWLLEQIPGQIVAEDVTSVLLKQGYWVGYNVPYFESIYNASGYPWPSIFQTTPRALIFKRDVGAVRSLKAMKRLLRYNRYQEDPLSLGLPNNAIASRYDLPPLPAAAAGWHPRAFGGVDGKIVDLQAMRSRTTYLVCGPTWDDQAPFSWAGAPAAFTNVSRDGSVDTFDFPWQRYTVQLCLDRGTC